METENNHLFTYQTICSRNYARNTRHTLHSENAPSGVRLGSDIRSTLGRRLSPVPASLYPSVGTATVFVLAFSSFTKELYNKKHAFVKPIFKLCVCVF